MNAIYLSNEKEFILRLLLCLTLFHGINISYKRHLLEEKKNWKKKGNIWDYDSSSLPSLFLYLFSIYIYLFVSKNKIQLFYLKKSFYNCMTHNFLISVFLIKCTAPYQLLLFFFNMAISSLNFSFYSHLFQLDNSLHFISHLNINNTQKP